jgi:16S rRNA (guanine966-N2)-methyltransferase
MRIVGGSHRGRKLAAPVGKNTRPTSDKLRQSIFNILNHAAWSNLYWPEKTVLDAFAGSGALGFESLSRGAAQAFFFDLHAPVIDCIKNNATNLGMTEKSQIIRASCLTPPPATSPANLIFLDPPYHQNLVLPGVLALQSQQWLGTQCIAVIETADDENLETPNGWAPCDQRSIGKSNVIFWRLL